MTTDAQRNELITDAKTLMSDADEIVKSMAGASGEKLADLGEKLRAVATWVAGEQVYAVPAVPVPAVPVPVDPVPTAPGAPCAERPGRAGGLPADPR